MADSQWVPESEGRGHNIWRERLTGSIQPRFVSQGKEI